MSALFASLRRAIASTAGALDRAALARLRTLEGPAGTEVERRVS